ncbi:MAG: TIGR00341 family protein [Hyphomonadaceae bacterium]
MSARLVEVIVADPEVQEARELLATYSRRLWQESVPGGREKFSSIVMPQDVEPALAALGDRFSHSPGFSAVVVQLEAVVPALAEADGEPVAGPDAHRPQTPIERFLSRDRRSTDEIYDDIVDATAITPMYLMTVVLSAIIAALAMTTGQTAVVIGAMVIAPLLSPTLAVAMAATVGDWPLGLRAMRTLLLGAGVVLVSTALLGLMLDFNPDTAELHNRTIVHLADIALALASGAAGVLALSKGASSSLVGVMIAVALVPPLSAAGLYFGGGEPVLGLRAVFLFANNLVCINIAGIAAFLVQGLPPKRWRITAGILGVWIVVLLLFVAMITGRIALGIAWSGET